MVADERRASASEIAGLERELERIQQQRFILQQARGYGLGGSKEIAFTLARECAAARRPMPRVRPACGSARRRRSARSSAG